MARTLLHFLTFAADLPLTLHLPRTISVERELVNPMKKGVLNVLYSTLTQVASSSGTCGLRNLVALKMSGFGQLLTMFCLENATFWPLFDHFCLENGDFPPFLTILALKMPIIGHF